MSSNDASPSQLIDAATVVVMRDCADDVELLMLRKNSKIYFGGMWVFPGGRVDAEDRNPEDADPLGAFRRAAVREAREEAAIDLQASELVHLSHWVPPPIRPKRFATHFFVTRSPQRETSVVVDGAEITEHDWISPRDALARREAGEIEFVTPTFVTLTWLSRFDRAADAIAAIGDAQSFQTHIKQTDGGNIAFYAGDVAYESLNHDAPGPRRRAYMLDSGWWWEEHDGQGNGPWPPP